jgi:hypothetical protein
MQYTIFETPVVQPFLHMISHMVLKLTGWRVEGRLPDCPKYLIVAPTIPRTGIS